MDKSWTKKKKLGTNRHPNTLQTGIPAEAEKVSEPLVTEKAEKKIQNFLILKSWRVQREKNKVLETEVKGLTTQVEKLQLQIYALRQLLDAERMRVVNANNDIRKILSALEECKREKQYLLKEKEQLEVRLRAMDERILGVENECKNQKNELITAKSEAQNWEKQLEKEREKLSKMKDERKFFIDEVRFKGNLLVWQIRSLEQFSRFYNILQSKSNSPALPWDESSARIEPFPEISTRQEKNLKDQRMAVIVGKRQESPELKALLVKAERKIREEDGKTEELEKSILGKTENEMSLVPYIPFHF